MSNMCPSPYSQLEYYRCLLDMHESEYRSSFNIAHLQRYWILYNYVKPWFIDDMPPIPDDLMAVIILEDWHEEAKP